MLMFMTHYSDIEDLLSLVAKGDRECLAELFNAEAGRLIGIAQRIVRRRDLAEEVVQDVFVAVWRKAEQFDPDRGSARGWLTTIDRKSVV